MRCAYDPGIGPVLCHQAASEVLSGHSSGNIVRLVSVTSEHGLADIGRVSGFQVEEWEAFGREDDLHLVLVL